MRLHLLGSYNDDAFKRVIFCRYCGQEEPFRSKECSGPVSVANEPPLEFASGLAENICGND